MVLSSMHRFQPRVHLVTRKNPMDNSPITNLENENYHTYIYPETVFTAVTAYQNQLITKLKIDSNPFAKGFRDSSRLNDYDSDYYGCPPFGSMPSFMSMGMMGGYPSHQPSGIHPFGPPPTPPHMIPPNPAHHGMLDPSTAALLFRSSPLFAAALAAQQQNAAAAAAISSKPLDLPNRNATSPGNPVGALSPDETNNNIMLEKARAAATMSMMMAKQQSNNNLSYDKPELLSPTRETKPIMSPGSLSSSTGQRLSLSPSITSSSASVEQHQLQALLAAHQQHQQSIYASRSAATANISGMPTTSVAPTTPYPPLGMSPSLLAQWTAMQQAQAAQLLMQQQQQSPPVTSSIGNSSIMNSKSSFSDSSSLLSISKSISSLSSQRDSPTYSRPGFPAFHSLGIQKFSPYIVKQSNDEKSSPKENLSCGNEEIIKRRNFDDRSCSESPIAVDPRSPRTSSSVDRESPAKSIVNDEEIDPENI